MNYEVVVQTGDSTNVYPVERFVVKGTHLVPVYDGDTQPADEHPMSVVTLRACHTVAALLFTDRGLVIGKRASTSKHSPGLWEIPGGKPEHGEGERVALRRELSEELAVNATLGTSLGVYPVTPPYVASVYTAYTDDVPLCDPDVHDEIREVSATSLPDEEEWAPGNYAIVALLLDKVEGMA